jgi:hypothetical protein
MRALLVPVVLAMGASIAACADATHDEQVQALGGEAPGVAPGPEHRPGQPCLVCHGGEGPASSSFSVAGTVYALFKESAPAVGAQVQIEDINGGVFRSPTNAAGNFYVTTSQWQPTYPIQMQVSLMAATNVMLTHVGREGSCATCHQAASGPASPGPVYVATDPTQLVGDGGTGP